VLPNSSHHNGYLDTHRRAGYPDQEAAVSSANVSPCTESSKRRHISAVESRIVTLGQDSIEIEGDDILATAAIRGFAGRTMLDCEVDAREIPRRPLSKSLAIRWLRWYRRRISPKLGQRCVFDPSCSRYAEVAIADKGIAIGGWLTVRRLMRCRPGAGGVDLPNVRSSR
jgi:putative membrane protein insertion efficiency factor